MGISTFSSQDCIRNTGKAAQRAAADGPVFITKDGHPSLVLLSFEEYQRLTGDRKTLLDWLSMPADEDIDFEPPRLGNGLYRPAARVAPISAA